MAMLLFWRVAHEWVRPAAMGESARWERRMVQGVAAGLELPLKEV